MLKKLFLLAIMLVIAPIALAQEADPEPAVAEAPATSREVLYGRIHAIKKKREGAEETIDTITFELLGLKPGEQVPQLILVFNSREREQNAIKQAGKPIWIEGWLGTSGTRNFVFVTSLLQRQ